jgi:hypothetical protein
MSTGGGSRWTVAAAPARGRRKQIAMEAPAPVVVEPREAPTPVRGEDLECARRPSPAGEAQRRLKSDQVGCGGDEEHQGGAAFFGKVRAASYLSSPVRDRTCAAHPAGRWPEADPECSNSTGADHRQHVGGECRSLDLPDLASIPAPASCYRMNSSGCDYTRRFRTGWVTRRTNPTRREIQGRRGRNTRYPHSSAAVTPGSDAARAAQRHPGTWVQTSTNAAAPEITRPSLARTWNRSSAPCRETPSGVLALASETSTKQRAPSSSLRR